MPRLESARLHFSLLLCFHPQPERRRLCKPIRDLKVRSVPCSRQLRRNSLIQRANTSHRSSATALAIDCRLEATIYLSRVVQRSTKQLSALYAAQSRASSPLSFGLQRASHHSAHLRGHGSSPRVPWPFLKMSDSDDDMPLLKGIIFLFIHASYC